MFWRSWAVCGDLMIWSKSVRRRVALIGAAVFLTVALILSPFTSTPFIGTLEVALLILIVPIGLLSRRIGTAWPMLALVSVIMGLLGAEERITSTGRSLWMFEIFVLLSIAFGIATLAECVRAYRKMERSSGPGPR